MRAKCLKKGLIFYVDDLTYTNHPISPKYMKHAKNTNKNCEKLGPIFFNPMILWPSRHVNDPCVVYCLVDALWLIVAVRLRNCNVPHDLTGCSRGQSTGFGGRAGGVYRFRDRG